MTNWYQCDVYNGLGVIETVVYQSNNDEQALADAWTYGEPVSDPEPVENLSTVEYFEHYAVERTQDDIAWIPYGDYCYDS